jgi:hypothetical protein
VGWEDGILVVEGGTLTFPTHHFGPYFHLRREDSVTRAVQSVTGLVNSSPGSILGVEMYPRVHQSFWEYISVVALTRVLWKLQHSVPLLGSVAGGEPLR